MKLPNTAVYLTVSVGKIKYHVRKKSHSLLHNDSIRYKINLR